MILEQSGPKMMCELPSSGPYRDIKIKKNLTWVQLVYNIAHKLGDSTISLNYEAFVEIGVCEVTERSNILSFLFF